MVDGGKEADRWALDGVLLWKVDVDFPFAKFVGGIGGSCMKMRVTDKIDKKGGVVFTSLNLLFSESKPVDVLFFSLQ